MYIHFPQIPIRCNRQGSAVFWHHCTVFSQAQSLKHFASSMCLQILLDLIMSQIKFSHESGEGVSIAHVHLVYQKMRHQISNMSEIFNMDVTNHEDEPLQNLVKQRIKEEQASIEENLEKTDKESSGFDDTSHHDQRDSDAEGEEAALQLHDESGFEVSSMTESILTERSIQTSVVWGRQL